jgi:hypothetical protein
MFQQYLMASLMVGYMHHIMSCEVYAQLQLIITMASVTLPHWDTLRRSRERIQEMLNLQLEQKESVLQNQCYSGLLAKILSHVSNCDLLILDTHGQCQLIGCLLIIIKRNWPTLISILT